MEKEMSIIDLLCGMDTPSAPTAEVKIKRLSELAKQEVVFKIKALSYDKISEANKFDDDYNINLVRMGTVEPSLKDEKLLSKFGAKTPNELLKKMLLPGEIAKIANKIGNLSGFEQCSVEEIKKKSE